MQGLEGREVETAVLPPQVETDWPRDRNFFLVQSKKWLVISMGRKNRLGIQPPLPDLMLLGVGISTCNLAP